MAVCCVIIGTHNGSKMQRYALLVSVSLAMCCLGFLFRSQAVDADSFIVGQKLVYCFVTHGMFLMLLFILEYCRFSIPNAVRWIFHGINFAVSFVVLTLDYHPMFYKSYWAVQQDGYVILEKEYGFMHTVAVLLFGLYMAAAVVITVMFSIRNMRKRSKYVWRILVAVMLPCLSYIVSKVTDSNNDLQPIAFAAFSVLVLIMIYQNNLYDIDNIVARYSIASVDDAIIVFDNRYSYKGCNKSAEKLFPILKSLNLDCDIRTEAPNVSQFADGGIAEYKNEKEIYSVTVCPIREGNIVQGKVVKFVNITLQRQYTDLLQAHKAELESKVVTLSDYSYKDDLTGLLNRRSFEDKVNEIRQFSIMSGVVVGIADLNGLKKVNDNVSHAAGDELIRGAGDILHGVFSEYGNVYRIGGDEYAVILTELPDNFEALVSLIDEKASTWKGNYQSPMSISYGFAFGRDYGKITIEQLLKDADKTMYVMKRNYYDRING